MSANVNINSNLSQQLAETTSFLKSKSPAKPAIAFVLGSGLSGFGKKIKVDHEIPFGEVPHFAVSSIEGHPGKLLLGSIEKVPVAVMQGRLHAYEGLSLQQVIYPVRALASLGARNLILTNAAGGLKKTMRPGDFMVIEDHINLTGENPLRGPNWENGPRFLDMTECYNKKLSVLLQRSLSQEKARFHKGIYVGVMGPSYETAAEIKFYGKIGGCAVGMSTVYEAIAARHAGMNVVGLSCITNLGTGLSKHKLSHEEVKEIASRVEEKFARTLLTFVRKAKDIL